jgi:hypothetical protein
MVLRRAGSRLLALLFILVIAAGWNLPSSSRAQSDRDEKVLRRNRLSFSEGSFRLNPCLSFGKEELCPDLRASHPEAERILENRRSRFDDRDSQGGVLLSLSGDRLELRLEGVSGEQNWLLRWKPVK